MKPYCYYSVMATENRLNKKETEENDTNEPVEDAPMEEAKQVADEEN